MRGIVTAEVQDGWTVTTNGVPAPGATVDYTFGDGTVAVELFLDGVPVCELASGDLTVTNETSLGITVDSVYNDGYAYLLGVSVAAEKRFRNSLGLARLSDLEEGVQAAVSAATNDPTIVRGQKLAPLSDPDRWDIKVSDALSAGVASKASSADGVPWSGVLNRPTTLAGYGVAEDATNTVCNIVTNEVHSFGDWVEEWDPPHYGTVYSFSGPYYEGGETWSGFYHPKNGMGIDESLTAVGGEFATRLVFVGDAGGTSFTVTLTRSHVAKNALGLARMSDLLAHTNRTDNPHRVTAAQVGALPISGGTLTGDLSVGEEHSASRRLTVAAENGANGITLQGGNSHGRGSSITVGGSTGIGGSITIKQGGYAGGTLYVEGSVDTGGGIIEVQGPYASIKKDNKEVATEAYVDEHVKNAVLPTDPAFSNAVLSVGLNIDTNSVAVLGEIAETFGGFPIEGTATTIGGLLAALAAAIAWLKKSKADKATTLAGYGITDGATKASLAPEYSPAFAYDVGAFVYHDGNIYQCTTEIADGGEAWNAEHWELRKLDDFFTESNSLLTTAIENKVNTMFDDGETTNYPRTTTEG